MNSLERVRPTSPQDVSRVTPLTSAVLWKVWLRIDDCTDDVNEPFALPFNELDTIDDLKCKIFEKLNSTRWSRLNDNASIAIGYYAAKDGLDEKPSSLSRPPTSPVGAAGALSGRSKNFDCPRPLSVGFSEDSHRRCYSVTASPSRSATNSPSLVRILQPPLIRYRSASPYGELTPVIAAPPPVSPINSVKCRVPGVLNKSYEFPSDDKSSEPMDLKVLFEPDELVITVYNSFFGHIGSQRACEALLIVSNEKEPELPLAMTAPPASLSTMNANTFTPTNDEITQQMLKSQRPDPKAGLVIQTDLPHHLNQDTQIIGAPDPLDSTISLEQEEEIEREFKLITNEEQLRKESQSLQDAEHTTDSPKPAILLLPKNYTGGVDLNELDTKSLSESPSPGPTTNDEQLTDSARCKEFIPTSPFAPLDEGEVGLIHPMLESGRKKNMISSPTSPQLPTKPATIVPNLPSYSSSGTSLHKNQLPNGFTNTTNHEIFPKINILIVEDNVINQAILRSFLKKHKISYKVAKNGQEAVDRWKEGGIDLIFMDLQLPVFSGMDAAKKIRDLEKQSLSQPDSSHTRNNKAPVIIVAFTASNSHVDKREALLSGCNDYLTKPVNLHWLSKKINEWGCMQALIDFDGWKQGQSRMTDSVIMKASPKFPRTEFGSGHSSSLRRSRSTSETRQ